MLIIRSLVVAAAGFWRFVIVVPFLLLLILCLTMIIGTKSSVFAWIFFASSANFAMLVAMRTAFAQIGEFSTPDLWKLMKGGVKYWLLHTVVTLILFFAAAMIVRIADANGMTGLGAKLRDSGFGQTFESAMLNPFFARVMYSAAALSALFWTALLVPQAAVAWSSTQKRDPFDMLWGFGARFFALVPVVALTFGVIIVTNAVARGYLLVDYVFYAGYAFMAGMSGDEIETLTQSEIIDAAFGALIVVLAAYWQAVAAALAFVDRRDQGEAERETRNVTAEDERVDAASLRRARQQV
ncbi:MAG: hypothetical protein ABI459_05450 [Deltaproteobacteria bacterium]